MSPELATALLLIIAIKFFAILMTYAYKSCFKSTSKKLLLALVIQLVFKKNTGIPPPFLVREIYVHVASPTPPPHPPVFKGMIYMASSIWFPSPLHCVAGFCNLQFLVSMDTILLYELIYHTVRQLWFEKRTKWGVLVLNVLLQTRTGSVYSK